MPSRMTMAQLLESLRGKAVTMLGAIGDSTAFMNDGNPAIQIGSVLQNQLGMNPLGDDILYDGMSGQQIPSSIFIGNIYIMRLKHMPEDKWNARAEGRKEQRTHQPTGGRGNQGGLRIGEMERDAIVGHGIMDFVQESYMKRADGYQTFVCNSCGTIPIYNERKNMYICAMCDGPVKFIGDNASSLEILPSNKRSLATFSKVEIPYSLKVLEQEIGFYLNTSMRILTNSDVTRLRGAPLVELTADQQSAALKAVLPQRVELETEIPEKIEKKDDFEFKPEELAALGLSYKEEEEALAPTVNKRVLNAAVEAAVNAVLSSTTTNSGSINSETVNAAVNAAIAATNAVPEVEEPLNSQASLLKTLTFAPATQTENVSEATNLGNEDYEEFPETKSQNQSQQNQSQQNQVSVQTSTQPVLVVPLNMVQNTAPPAEMLQSPAPGAPPTFTVDTKSASMNMEGGKRSSRSSSPSSEKVSVTKMSSPSGSESPVSPSTRVTVVKGN